ncbi:MAG TPA: PDZ domain-containing protein, partial [Longimicrobiales bacterium]|nr:PDZ domain-containing protein [Longimicrobiales bacterium]
LSFATTVSFNTQPGWKVATAMKSNGANVYREENFHDLVDMPVFIGAFDFDSAQANGKWNRLASYPASKMPVAARQTLLDEIGKLLAKEAAVFNEMPWQTYTTMIIWDSAFGGASALEHQRSHVGVYNQGLIGNPIITSITAHEMFHAWNVKRMRPSEMWPYRYGAEQPTPWLWVSEGITDYYADLAMSRAQLGGADFFYNVTGGKIAQVEQTPPVALEDASLSTWIHPIDGTGYIYYPKGSLAGLMLDIMIRDASNNAKSLDTVMREVYTSGYKQGRGFTSADWWGAVSRAADGKSFTEFNAKYIDQREPYPWDELLPLAGMRMRTDTIYDPRLGVNLNQVGDTVVALSVVPGGEAAAAGVQPGDAIVSVGTVKITQQDASFEEFRNAYRNAAPGSALAIVVRRNGREMTLNAKVRLVARTESHLEPDPNASAKAVRIREGILQGR